MDGYEALEVLRAESALGEIPVIALTSNAMRQDIAKGFQAGFSDYLTKPLMLDSSSRTWTSISAPKVGNSGHSLPFSRN